MKQEITSTQSNIPHLRVSFVWSTQKSLQRGNKITIKKKKKPSELIVRSVNKVFRGLCYVIFLLLPPSSAHHAVLYLKQICKLIRWWSMAIRWVSSTYIGSSSPTSCLQFPGSTSVCVHTPAVHLANTRQRCVEKHVHGCVHTQTDHTLDTQLCKNRIPVYVTSVMRCKTFFYLTCHFIHAILYNLVNSGAISHQQPLQL